MVVSSHNRGGNWTPREAKQLAPGHTGPVTCHSRASHAVRVLCASLCLPSSSEVQEEVGSVQCVCVSDYSDSTEVKFEELKNVKLEEEEEEEEEQEVAALDLSVNPASLGGRLVFSGSKKKSSSSLGSSSSQDSVSSDSETSEPLSCRAQGQMGVLTVHSYAKGDNRVAMGEPCLRKKGGASGSVSERELAEV